MAIAAQEGAQPEAQSTDLERKPLMSFRNILLMNFGFFGIQYSFGLQQTAINPIFQLIGADAHSLPILNLAVPGPRLLVPPVICAVREPAGGPRWGRRKHSFLLGALGWLPFLFLFPW